MIKIDETLEEIQKRDRELEEYRLLKRMIKSYDDWSEYEVDVKALLSMLVKGKPYVEEVESVEIKPDGTACIKVKLED